MCSELHGFMLIYYTIESLRAKLSEFRAQNQSLGFVPTMGALHQGHLSLIAECQKKTKVSICSIFVNPTQFNNTNDLAKYPVDLERDIDLLKSAGCDILFAPSAAEMYPNGPESNHFDFGKIERVMEGEHRPGHFNGVGTVVGKFFEIIEPDIAFFGEKDFQQLAIINKLVELKNYDVEIAGCPILREPDGLAMSSRNVRLTKEQRKAAPTIFKSLQFAKYNYRSFTPNTLKEKVQELINIEDELNVEHVEIRTADNLSEVVEWPVNTDFRIFVAVFAGEIRLIDNEQLN